MDFLAIDPVVVIGCLAFCILAIIIVGSWVGGFWPRAIKQTEHHIWITGAYEPLNDEFDDDDWVTFSYGPFRTQYSADKIADNHEKMLSVIGKTFTTGRFEIDDVSQMTYGQACKHFEETIESPFFERLLPLTHAAHIELMNRKVN